MTCGAAISTRRSTASTRLSTASTSALYLPLSGGVISGDLTVNGELNVPNTNIQAWGLVSYGGQITLDAYRSSLGRSIDFTTAGVLRWSFAVDASPENGTNSGSDCGIVRSADNGVPIDTPLRISRATGVTDFTKTPTVLGVPIGGSITQAYVDAGDAARVLKAGDTMTGSLKLPNGSNAVPALNFGTANTGLLGNAAGTSITMSFAGQPVYLFQQSSFVSSVNIRTGDGLVGGAGFGFGSEPSSGLYRKGSGSVSVTANASEIMNWNNTGKTTTAYGPVILAADPAAALGAATKQYVDAIPTTYPIGDNRIINGDMRIDQRNGGVTGTTSNIYTVDRWYYNASLAGKVSWGRAGGAGSGAQNATGCPYYLIGTTVAAYTAAATDICQFAFRQSIEADMISDFAWGQANAQPVTLSFWVFGTQPGTYGGCIGGGAAYPFTFPVTSAWTKVVITIPPPTVGTWTLAGNAAGAVVYFDLGNGANFRGPPNVWSTSDYRGASGTTNLLATLNASLYLTGVKLEIGSVATPFNRQSLAKSMADCQRYYQGGSTIIVWQGATVNGVLQGAMVQLSPILRATPTVVNAIYNGRGLNGFPNGTALVTNSGICRQRPWVVNCIDGHGNTATGANNWFAFTYTASAEL